MRHTEAVTTGRGFMEHFAFHLCHFSPFPLLLSLNIPLLLDLKTRGTDWKRRWRRWEWWTCCLAHYSSFTTLRLLCCLPPFQICWGRVVFLHVTNRQLVDLFFFVRRIVVVAEVAAGEKVARDSWLKPTFGTLSQITRDLGPSLK